MNTALTNKFHNFYMSISEYFMYTETISIIFFIDKLYMVVLWRHQKQKKPNFNQINYNDFKFFLNINYLKIDGFQSLNRKKTTELI